MRFHREWPLAQFWANRRTHLDIILPETLVMARLESVLRRDLPALQLDLRFAQGDVGFSIPQIFVDELAMNSKLRDVCIWPEVLTKLLKDKQLAALEQTLQPWLEFALTARGVTQEHVHCFGQPAAAAEFEAARSAGAIGAARFAQTAPSLLLAQFAGRFASGAQLAATGRHLHAAALLAPICGDLRFGELCDAEQAIVQRWYGLECASLESSPRPIQLMLGAALRERATCESTARVIDTEPHAGAMRIPYETPHAVDDLFRVGEFTAGANALYVATADRELPAAALAPSPVVGGSQGKVLMLSRADNFAVPGADIDEAASLATILASEGFSVETATELFVAQVEQADIIHAFGLAEPKLLERALEIAKTRGIPFVCTPFFEDAANDARWGAHASRALLGAAEDDSEIDRGLLTLAARRVDVDGLTAQARADDGFDSLRREILRRADIVTVNGPSEREALQRFSGRRRRIIEIPPLASSAAEPAQIAAFVPDSRFILIDAACDPRHNLGLVMRAVRAVELPAVLIAPAVDRRLFRLLQNESLPSTAIVSHVTVNQRESLYAQSAVYVDAAWQGEGARRLVHAAAYGSELVVARSRHLPTQLEARAIRVDSASVASISSGIADAWQRSRADGMRELLVTAHHTASSMRGYVAAYAQAGEHLGQSVVHA